MMCHNISVMVQSVSSTFSPNLNLLRLSDPITNHFSLRIAWPSDINLPLGLIRTIFFCSVPLIYLLTKEGHTVMLSLYNYRSVTYYIIPSCLILLHKKSQLKRDNMLWRHPNTDCLHQCKLYTACSMTNCNFWQRRQWIHYGISSVKSV